MSQLPEGASDFYDALAPLFDVMTDWDARLAGEGPFLRAVLEQAGARRVLDAACGSGGHTLALASWGYQALGIDVSERMIALARSKAAAQAVSDVKDGKASSAAQDVSDVKDGKAVADVSNVKDGKAVKDGKTVKDGTTSRTAKLSRTARPSPSPRPPSPSTSSSPAWTSCRRSSGRADRCRKPRPSRGSRARRRRAGPPAGSRVRRPAGPLRRRSMPSSASATPSPTCFLKPSWSPPCAAWLPSSARAAY